MTGISSALDEAFVCESSVIHCLVPNVKIHLLALSADPLLVWNYGAISVVIFVTGCLFWWSVKDLDAKEDQLNEISEGHIGNFGDGGNKQNA